MDEKMRSRLLLYAVIAVVAIIVLSIVLRDRAKGPGQLEFKNEPVITLYNNETGEKQEIKMEEYICGVVAAEMDPQWPKEALATQAILARTFTLHKMSYEGGVPQHDADASTATEEFQAYDAARINDNVREAVAMTRGMVIKYQGKYVRSWFHSNAGGQTATAEEGLDFHKEETPYIKSVEDPGQEVAPLDKRTWEIDLPVEEVRQAVKEEIGQDPGTFSSVEITAKGPSGRATGIRLGNTEMSGPALRLALGPEVMLSTLLDALELRGNTLFISGRGFGHGVGMSQWGAYYYAKEGKTPEDIIKNYYHDVTVDMAWR